MNDTMKNIKHNKANGFSLIEIMIAILIGLIMVAAIISLFENFSHMNRAQNGLARVQENGRFIAISMRKDLENVGSQPCATISMDSPLLIKDGFATKPYINFTTLDNGMPNVPVIDTQYLIRGSECDKNGLCSPLTNLLPGGDSYSKVPAAGNVAGKRAFQTDVLTVRYIATDGVNIATSTTNSLTIAQNATDAPLEMKSGDKILLSNCKNTMILDATASGSTFNITSSDPKADVSWTGGDGLSYIYNFTQDFLTVSYYVGLKAHPNNSSKVISSLYRVENGKAAQEIIEGVERFDLSYGVKFKDGTVGYLDAKEVQDTPVADCIIPPLVPSSLGLGVLTNGTGCLWRSVFAVKLNVLLNTVYDSSFSVADTYTYSPDGDLLNPQTPTTIPSQTPPGKMYRREFTETISLRSNNL